VVVPERTRVAHAEARLLEDLTAECRPLVDERDVKIELCRLDGGGEPGRPAADDEEVITRGS
jgi:hypothetical protein